MSEFTFTWLIPPLQAVSAATSLFANRQAIQDARQKLINLFTTKTRIAVMGMSGVGKTVLIDYILGKGGIDYRTPLISQSAEYGMIKIQDKNIEFIIVPGQEQGPRHEALQELEKNPPTGIIHVFANGYANTRNTAVEASLIEQGIDTIEKIRKRNLDLELDDLKRTCSLIESLHSKHKKPQWILVTATKIDLYADGDSLRAAEKQYKHNDSNNSDNNSLFVNTLNNLVKKIGDQNIRWEAFHVCSRLEAFEWNGDRHMLNVVDENQRDRLLCDFMNSMINYC